jgi:hemerythrin-like domain-containing protein
MPQSAIELLKTDHQKVQDLLEQLAGTTERAKKTRAELLQKIESELSVHTRLEEEIFYPAFRETDGKEHRKMYFEATEEHRAVEKLVLPDLKDTDPATDEFAGRVKVLKELLQHHISDEENEMFPEAEETLGSEQLEELGRRMEERRKELRGRH